MVSRSRRRDNAGRVRDRVNPCEKLLVRCPLVLIMLRKHKNWVPIRNNKRWPAWPAHPEAAAYRAGLETGMGRGELGWCRVRERAD